MNHTPGHRDCPACRAKAFTEQLEIAGDSAFPEAAALWIKSREFNGSRGARFVSPRSLQDFAEYAHSLSRFFAQPVEPPELPLNLREIHLGHLRQYQEDRSNGLLGPTPEELFPRFAKRLARKLKVSIDDVRENPEMLAIVEAQIAAYPQREVNPNKVNQEVAMLIRVMKVAGVWTPQMEEKYEPLQHVESDIPQALTPDEQDWFLRKAREISEFVYCYAVLGIHATLSTKEERSLKIGDVNTDSGIVMVRNESAKNKYRIRTIPLTAEAVWAVQRMIERANSLGSRSPQHYLMPFRVVRNQFDPNRPMTVSGIKYPWNQIRIAAGLPWVTPYDLRHTGCTRYAEDGMSIHILLAMAGHMTRKMQQHYIHISEAAKRKAVQKTHGDPAPRAIAAKKSPEKVAAWGTSVLISHK
ncbi:MAG TPA: site-specific integrase [Candidatus Angelobacter sp.]